MASIDHKIITSPALALLSSRSIAFFEIFISNKSIGIITGKLKIAINVAEFSPFEAIPAISESVEAEPPSSAPSVPVTDSDELVASDVVATVFSVPLLPDV